MNRHIKTTLLLISILTLSCQTVRYHSLKNSKEFSRTKTQTIKLRDRLSDTLVCYETVNATIIIGLYDAKHLIEKELSKKLTSEIRDEEGCKALLEYFEKNGNSPLKFSNPLIFKSNNENEFILNGVFYNWLARELTLNRRVKIFSKQDKKFVSEIQLKVYYDRLGNYNESFILPNGLPFLDGKVMYGE